MRPGRHADGGGLFLCVVDLDHRFWTYRYRFAGKETELGLGSYPKVGLAEARRLHADLRDMLANGSNPRDEKRRAPKGDVIDPLALEQAAKDAGLVKALLAARVKLDPATTPDLTSLYRHYDRDGTLLYVGVTQAPMTRAKRHKEESPWGHLIAIITIDDYPTKDEAEAAEADAILAEHPIYNCHVALYRKRYLDARGMTVSLWPRPQTKAAE